MDTPNECYMKPFYELFKLKSFNGILGGKPNSAFYFIGL